MTFEQKNNSGVLFHSQKKSDKAPDYTGECVVDGVKLRIAGWKKTSQKGTTFLSLAFSDEQGPTKAPVKAPVKDEEETDFPF